MYHVQSDYWHALNSRVRELTGNIITVSSKAILEVQLNDLIRIIISYTFAQIFQVFN